MKFNYKSKNMILIIVLIILILISIVIYNFRNNNELALEESNMSSYRMLNDYSRFFTVNSCIIRYISYIENKDIDSLLKVLDEDYVNNNGINSNNIYSFIDELDGNYSFISKKMYYEKISDRYIKYYVYGNLMEDTISGEVIKEYKYYIVTLDIEEQLFNISPYDGRVFREDI